MLKHIELRISLVGFYAQWKLIKYDESMLVSRKKTSNHTVLCVFWVYNSIKIRMYMQCYIISIEWNILSNINHSEFPAKFCLVFYILQKQNRCQRCHHFILWFIQDYLTIFFYRIGFPVNRGFHSTMYMCNTNLGMHNITHLVHHIHCIAHLIHVSNIKF